MPRPNIHPKILQMAKEFWAEDPGRSGLEIHELLKKEPIIPPSLRWVQLRVSELNRDAIKLGPQVPLQLWDPEWFENPDKSRVLLALHYVGSNIEGAEFPGLTIEEAKWGLRLSAFFDLSSPVQTYQLLRFADFYCRLERTALMLNQTMDTRELDVALLKVTGMFGENLPKVDSDPVSDFMGDLKRLSPELFYSNETEETVNAPPITKAIRENPERPTGATLESSSPMVDLWKQIDWMWVMTDRQSFISEGQMTAESDEDWNDSKEKVLFDAREKAIQEIVDLIYATPEGKAAHEQFLKETNIVPRVRISGPWS